MTIADLQIIGNRHDTTELLRNAVRHSIAVRPWCFIWKINGVAAFTYSFNILARCECHCGG